MIVGPAYAIGQILADAIERAGTLDGAAIRDVLENYEVLESLLGNLAARKIVRA